MRQKRAGSKSVAAEPERLEMLLLIVRVCMQRTNLDVSFTCDVEKNNAPQNDALDRWIAASGTSEETARLLMAAVDERIMAKQGDISTSPLFTVAKLQILDFHP